MVEVGYGVGWLRWARFAGVVRLSIVVVANVFREHQTQVPLTEDQHMFGQFGWEGAEEPFGETVRSRTARRNPDYRDAHIGEDGVEGCGELAGPVADEDLELGEVIAEIHDEGADVLGGPSALGVGGRAQQVYGPVSDL
jgi:hypothetical protein